MNQPIDFLFAGIMPEVNEAAGMARAMAETGIPYIISFMVRKEGSLIDGNSIAEAIRIIDSHADPKPVCYMANCIHPVNLRLALSHPKNAGRDEMQRFKGLQANSSTLSPEELNSCDRLEQEDYSQMVDEMLFLHDHYDLKVLGGCCGTDDQFLNDLAAALRIK